MRMHSTKDTLKLEKPLTNVTLKLEMDLSKGLL